MVELVDDHDVEACGVDVGETSGIEALDGGEHVLVERRASAIDPQFAEAVTPECVPKGPQALVEDLLAMRDEQQPRARQSRAEPGVVDRGHDRLARARRCHEEVAMMPLLTREFDLLEQPLLERLRTKLDRAEDECRAPVARRRLLGEDRRVVGHEIAAVPVALEDRGDFVDDVGIASA